jgi:hypothetical protein
MGLGLVRGGRSGLLPAHLALHRALQVPQHIVGADGEVLDELVVGLQVAGGWAEVVAGY